jgi:fructosamine-3-kinase
MFGGFPDSFYDEYHSLRPKSEPVEEYDKRLKLYQLFHYLNHTVLFGVSSRRDEQNDLAKVSPLLQSGYASQSMNLTNQLLKSLPS